MIIDWNCKSAEGKDYCLYCDESNYIFCKQEPRNNGEYWLVGFKPFVIYYTLYKRPEVEQMKETIYTKEMHERGETIGSGMTAIYEDKEVIIRLGCDTLRNVVFRLDGEWVTVNVDYIKPIDTRTDREKAIDDINYILMNEVSGKTTRQIAEHMVNKLEYLTFTGDK